jgi:hypothetical protein
MFTDFQASTLLVIKDFAEFHQSSAKIESEKQQHQLPLVMVTFPTELHKFKWHLHAQYSGGKEKVVSFALMEELQERSPDFKFEGEYLIDYE